MPFDPSQLAEMPGRVAIVTGANTGLGFETARVFAQKGIKTILACRTESKALAAQQRLLQEFPNAQLPFMQLDLSDLDNVRAFAAKFRERGEALDILVLNAGIMMPPYSKSVDGFESQMAANYFGHFLLTSLLLDLIPDTPESRVVALSSNAHKMGKKKIHFDDMQFESKYSAMNAYAQTKLACLMFANKLNRVLKDNNRRLVAVSAHHGASDTDLGRSMNKVLAGIARYTVIPFITHTPDKAAHPQIQAALDAAVEGGDYYGPQGFQELKGPSGKVRQLPYALDVAHQDRLWDVSCELTGATFPIAD